MSEEFVPKSTKELYEKMCSTKQLCGEIIFDNEEILWKLFDGINITISIEPPETYFGVDKKIFGIIPDSITHWHPECENVYQEILDIGTEGNVLVIRKNILFTSVLYMGKEENCPYLPNIKWRFGKIYYLKADNKQV